MRRRWLLSAAVLAASSWASCAAPQRVAPPIEAHLWKRAHPPVELVLGGVVVPGDELYMTVSLRRAAYVYVIDDEGTGRRQIIFPCHAGQRSRALAPRRLYRLPPPLLGRESFWPAEAVAPRERLLVLAMAQPAAALEASLQAADDAQPCAAALAGSSQRWLEGLLSEGRGANGAPGDAGGGLWSMAPAGQEGSMLVFRLAGTGDHG
jgi:hypothetical protein